MTDDLETLIRDGLRRRADGVDTTAPLVARARQTVRRRRGTRVVLASAAAVVAVVGVTAVVTDGPEEVVPAPTPAPTRVLDPTDPTLPPVAQELRTERWHDLAVDVPADWGYGPAPQRTGGAPHICGDLPEDPYVGRPVSLSDECIGGDYLRESAAPYVWLGGDVEPGVVTLPGGGVQETVAVAGTTLTVAGDDVLRRRILASARIGGTCPSELRQAPSAPLPLADTGAGLQVCAYRNEEGLLRLVGSQLLEEETARRFTEAYAAEPTYMYRCAKKTDHELVLLQAGDRQFVVAFTCPGIAELGGEPGLRGLTTATVAPWVRGVVPFVLHGPTGGKGAMIDSLIGTLP